RVTDEPPEAARLGRARLGAQPPDARARLLDPLGGQGRRGAAPEAALREPTRRERLCERAQDAQQAPGIEVTPDYNNKPRHPSRIDSYNKWRHYVCSFHRGQAHARLTNREETPCCRALT